MIFLVRSTCFTHVDHHLGIKYWLFNVDYNGKLIFLQWQISRTWFQTELKLPNAFCTVWGKLCCIGHLKATMPCNEDIILLLISLGSPKQTQKMNGGKECDGGTRMVFQLYKFLGWRRVDQMECFTSGEPFLLPALSPSLQPPNKESSLLLWERKILWLVAPQINLNKWSLCWKY